MHWYFRFPPGNNHLKRPHCSGCVFKSLTICQWIDEWTKESGDRGGRFITLNYFNFYNRIISTTVTSWLRWALFWWERFQTCFICAYVFVNKRSTATMLLGTPFKSLFRMICVNRILFYKYHLNIWYLVLSKSDIIVINFAAPLDLAPEKRLKINSSYQIKDHFESLLSLIRFFSPQMIFASQKIHRLSAESCWHS